MAAAAEDNAIDTRDLFIITLMAKGLLRQSEVVAARRVDLSLEPRPPSAKPGDLLCLVVRKGKGTTEPHQRWVRAVVGPESLKRVCPVYWWRRYEPFRNGAEPALVQPHDSDAMVARARGEPCGGLANGTINSMVKRRAAEGLAGNYGSHSLRRSGATHAAARGVAREVLEAAGHWARQSRAMERYIVPSRERILEVGDAFRLNDSADSVTTAAAAGRLVVLNP